MKKSKSNDWIHERRVGLRWGKALGAIGVARNAFSIVHSERFLLPEKLQAAIQEISDRLLGLEVTLWTEEARGVK